MCLVAFAVGPAPGIALVLAGNRDELFARATRPAHAWTEAEHVFAGRDLEKGGTWLGVSSGSRLATITNVRAPGARREGRSRGVIAADYLVHGGAPDAYAASIAHEAGAYPAFNALFVRGREAVYANEAGETRALGPGTYVLSNARLDDPWPKTERLRAVLDRAMGAHAGGEELALAPLFEALADRTHAPDDALPSTGVPLELERLLSSPFVRDEVYGTRASTVVVLFDDGRAAFEERTFDAAGEHVGTISRALVLGTP